MSDPVVGRTFGPYRVTAPLGKGGMGEVYVAVDERLGRRVALKFLPGDATVDRKTRFTAEARAASALHHPNIVTIFDAGTADGRDYFAMELVEGETLRNILQSRRLTSQRAIEVAADIASALAAGHAGRIIHRDVKPENIVITAAGQAKLLDYGLAKVLPPQISSYQSTTLAVGPQATQPGMLLGTVAYMSPEQAEGKEVDHRSDIFSLGAVLYEMLTGQPPFTGGSSVDVLHKIINVEPRPVHSLNPTVPQRLMDVLEKALAKDPAWRYASAADLRLDLLRLNRGEQRPSESPPRRALPSLLALALVAILAAALAALGTWRWRESVAVREQPHEDFRLALLTDDPGYEGEPTFSPDGETIAYTSDRSGNLEIYLKQISGGPDVNLTNDPADDAQPSFSPDGKQIAFVSARSSRSQMIYRNPGTPLLGGDIWIMPALGGAPRKIAEEANFPSWSADGQSLLFIAGPWSGQKIYRVAATGGAPTEVPVKFGQRHLFLFHPRYSPDGRWIIFGAQNEILFVVPSSGGAPRLVGRGRSPAWNGSGSAVLYSNSERDRNFSLWKVAFDTKSGLLGEPRPMTIGRGRDVQACASRDGQSVVFAAENVTFNVERIRIDEESGRLLGAPEPITSGTQINHFFSVSPDAGAVVYQSLRSGTHHLWRADLGKPAVQLTAEAEYSDTNAAWSPDGSRIAFLRRRNSEIEGPGMIHVMRADGSDPQPLFKGSAFLTWSPDSRGIAYYSAADQQQYLFDIATRQSHRITSSPKVRSGLQFSPDGQWLVFQVLGTNGTTDIRAMNLDREPAVIDVMATPREDYHPWVSSSGRWLYAQFDHKNVVRVPGPAQQWRKAPPQKVTFFPESNLYLEVPQLSRDGKWLYYSRGVITSDLWVLRTGRTGPLP